jgi:hypothetical protein
MRMIFSIYTRLTRRILHSQNKPILTRSQIFYTKQFVNLVKDNVIMSTRVPSVLILARIISEYAVSSPHTAIIPRIQE